VAEHVHANGIRFSVEDAGTGSPIVFVHGWSMSGRCFQRPRDLTGAHRVVIPDLRGHGRSENGHKEVRVGGGGCRRRPVIEEIIK
jgi:pimeloyl-ACP methyl ester carboxylesterase